jgi:hypothetical protein
MADKTRMTKPISGLLISLALIATQTLNARGQALPSAGAQSNTTADSQTEKINAKVGKIGMGKDATVTMRSGDDYHGSIKSIAADSFVIYEVDLKQPLEFKYAEVKRVQSGYGHSRDLHGRRIPPHKQRIGLIVGLAAILVPVIVVVAGSREH